MDGGLPALGGASFVGIVQLRGLSLHAWDGLVWPAAKVPCRAASRDGGEEFVANLAELTKISRVAVVWKICLRAILIYISLFILWRASYLFWWEDHCSYIP